MPYTQPLLTVVDDDAEVRSALARLAASTRYRAETYASGAEFLRSLRDHASDCVILDLHMPEMSGLEVLQAMARSGAKVPVLVITGYDSPDMRAAAMRLGARAYFPKPVDDEALLAAIAAVLPHGADRLS